MAVRLILTISEGSGGKLPPLRTSKAWVDTQGFIFIYKNLVCLTEYTRKHTPLFGLPLTTGSPVRTQMRALYS
jgi:hypothetical protein